jgi:hypothetical protein
MILCGKILEYAFDKVLIIAPCRLTTYLEAYKHDYKQVEHKSCWELGRQLKSPNRNHRDRPVKAHKHSTIKAHHSRPKYRPGPNITSRRSEAISSPYLNPMIWGVRRSYFHQLWSGDSLNPVIWRYGDYAYSHTTLNGPLAKSALLI